MLEGIDKDWINLGNRRSIIYSNLPHGKYLFRVKAQSFDGRLSNEANVIVMVKQSFFTSIWIWLIITLIIVGVIFAFYRMRFKMMNRINIRLKQMVDDRTLDIMVQKEELKRSNQSKDKMFSVLGHDLRNPFNIVSGFIRLLLDRYHEFDDEKRLEMLRVSANASENAVELLDNLLQWSRLNTNKIEARIVEVDLLTCLNHVLETLKFNLENKQLQVIKPENNIKVFSDFDLLTIILRNIISNAIKFSPIGETIKIFWETTESSVEIYIEDNGIGIPENVQKRIFLGNNYSTYGTQGEKGAGIGLSLCKEFVEICNGSISFASKDGEGTVFKIRLFKTN
jgi:signal transduction histidine kinase